MRTLSHRNRNRHTNTDTNMHAHYCNIVVKLIMRYAAQTHPICMYEYELIDDANSHMGTLTHSLTQTYNFHFMKLQINSYPFKKNVEY